MKIKIKKKNDKIDDSEKIKIIKTTESLMKKYIAQVNSDEQIQNKIRKEIDELFKQDEEFYSDIDELGRFKKTNPKLKFHRFEDNPNVEDIILNTSKNWSIIYDVANYGQTTNSIMSIASNEVVRLMQKDSTYPKEYIKKINTGDGDEGCIYIDYKW